MADTKVLTPMQRAEAAEAKVTELNAELLTAKSERDGAVENLTAALNEGTTIKGQLAAEKSAHADTKAKLVTAEASFASEKTAHDLLKTNFAAEVTKQAALEAARIVAGQGLPDPVNSAVNQNPGKTDPGKGAKKDAIESLAAGAAADLAKIAA